MKVAILLPDVRGGGVERIRLVLAHEFARAGHEVEFVLMQARGELLEEARASFSVVDLGVPRIRNGPIALANYLRRHRPDALLAAMWPLTVIAPVARLLSGHECRVLVSEHNLLSLQYSNWGIAHRIALRATTTYGYRLADKCIAVSQGVARDMANLSSLSNRAFTVIHNPVPVRPAPSTSELSTIEQIWATPAGARILTVGSLKAVKNHRLLLQAFAGLEHPDARLMLVGSGSLEDELRKFARELDIPDRVIFTGFQPDPTPYYMTTNLFVLSSNNEGFGNVIVEALSCGTPVVSTNCPSGPAEILENGRYGMLTNPGDPEELTRAMQIMLNSTVDRKALKRRAAEFSPEIAARRYLDLMRL